jgi:hypothetical protein
MMCDIFIHIDRTQDAQLPGIIERDAKMASRSHRNGFTGRLVGHLAKNIRLCVKSRRFIVHGKV